MCHQSLNDHLPTPTQVAELSTLAADKLTISTSDSRQPACSSSPHTGGLLCLAVSDPWRPLVQVDRWRGSTDINAPEFTSFPVPAAPVHLCPARYVRILEVEHHPKIEQMDSRPENRRLEGLGGLVALLYLDGRGGSQWGDRGFEPEPQLDGNLQFSPPVKAPVRCNFRRTGKGVLEEWANSSCTEKGVLL